MRSSLLFGAAAIAAAFTLSSCVTNVVEESAQKESVQNAHGYTGLRMTNSDSYDVSIAGWNADSIHARANLSIWARSGDKAKEIANNLDFGWTPNASIAELAVRYKGQDQELAKLTHLAIDAPARLGIELETSSGDLDISGMTGDLNLKSSSGTMHASTLGHLTAESSSGDLYGKTALGGTLETSSGDVELDVTNKSFEGVNITTSSGDVILRVADGAAISFDLETTSGSIKLNYAGTSTTTSNDRLRVNVNGGGKVVRVNTSSGDIKVSTL